MKNLIPILLLLFVICDLQAQQITTNLKNSWLGNSNADPTTFMPQGIEGMFVSPDGTVYTNVGWEEGGGQYTQVKNGEVMHGDGSFGWGKYGGSDVAANSKYVFFASETNNENGNLNWDPIAWPPVGKVWQGVSRRNKLNIKTGTDFVGAKGQTPFKYFLAVYELPEDGSAIITGVYASEAELFVACAELNQIRVYDANSMQFKREFNVTSPYQMAMDSYGKLWVAIGNNATKIERYDANGVKQSQQLQLPANSLLGDFCIDKNDRILLGDVGSREQVLIFTNINTTPSFTATFGIEKGIYSGVPGKHEPLKFNQIRGIGTDNTGNIYVCSTQWGTGGEGTILENYNSITSTINWSRYCVMFVDAMGIDAATDGKDIYGKVEHFTIDYSKPEGQEATLSGYTINKYKYPYDPRLHGELASVAVRNIKGKKFLAMSSMNGGLDVIYRFNPATDGEVAIPCVVFGWKQDSLYPGSPATPWIWVDLNANGQPNTGEYVLSTAHVIPDGGFGASMDDNGDIWVAVGTAINHIKCTGVDVNGILKFDSRFDMIPLPKPFKEVRRVQYNVGLDKMFLGGATNNYPDYNPWRAMGRAIHRYDNWSKGNRLSSGELVVPFDTLNKGETVSFDAEGDYIFTAFDIGYTTKVDERDGTARPVMGQINIYKSSDNSSTGYIRPPWDNIGWMDVVQCIDVFKRSNGEYVIVQEDDGRNKNIMYRWCASGNCKEILSATESEESQQSYSIYPNPTKTELSISGNFDENLKYEITSIEGKNQQSGALSGGSISIESLKAGFYLIKIKTAAGERVQRFVKE